MKKLALLSAFLALPLMFGCAKHVPIPNQRDTFDGQAYRAVFDAQRSISDAKQWETCADQNYPATIVIDNATYACDKWSGKGAFPVRGRDPLFRAEQAYNIAAPAQQAYHAGTGDQVSLQNALNALSVAVTAMLTSIQGGK